MVGSDGEGAIGQDRHYQAGVDLHGDGHVIAEPALDELATRGTAVYGRRDIGGGLEASAGRLHLGGVGPGAGIPERVGGR